jgi:glycosyltransferase involved in cell wall biosynthesis
MPEMPLKILVDLSPAGTGYAGIPQDARLTFKLLAGLPNVAVTGLLFPSAGQMEWPKFSRDIDPRRGLRSLASSIESVTLEKPADMELVWQRFLSPTLSEPRRSLLQRCQFVIAPLSNRMMFARAALGLPPPVLQTQPWDVALFHGALPLRVTPSTRKLVRLYDMIPAKFPELVANLRVTKAHRLGLKQCISDATFICGSDPTRTDLIAAYPEAAARSVTIPHALASACFREENAAKLAEIFQQRRSSRIAGAPPLENPGDYILAVSTIEPRKNYPTLLDAFALLRKDHPQLQLVIVGNLGWKYEQVAATMAPLIAGGAVIHLEGVASEEMRLLYTHARAFATTSLYEGFGFPPLEAMQCGTPVVASDIPAHRWALGDAALYADPKNSHAVAAALARLLDNDSTMLRQSMTARGLQQAARYSIASLSPAWQSLLLEPPTQLPAVSGGIYDRGQRAGESKL